MFAIITDFIWGILSLIAAFYFWEEGDTQSAAIAFVAGIVLSYYFGYRKYKKRKEGQVASVPSQTKPVSTKPAVSSDFFKKKSNVYLTAALAFVAVYFLGDLNEFVYEFIYEFFTISYGNFRLLVIGGAAVFGYLWWKEKEKQK